MHMGKLSEENEKMLSLAGSTGRQPKDNWAEAGKKKKIPGISQQPGNDF